MNTGRIADLAEAFWIINRFPSLLAYNVGYLLIIIGISHRPAVMGRALEIAIFFFAVIFMKAHASIADAIHDYPIDRMNPEKSYVPDSVDTIGKKNARTLMIVELLLGLWLWGYLSYLTGDPLYVTIGAISSFFGYTYSYPPRFKEQGAINHLVTSAVDVLCILLPGIVLLSQKLTTVSIVLLGVVFLYSYSYHIMYQIGDTYYDRKSGISTFTQRLGVANSLLVSLGLLAVAAAVSLIINYILLTVVLLFFAVNFTRIYIRACEMGEQRQSDFVSSSFDISRCATVINISLAANTFLAGWV
ncbi:UbiA family prenyltransferase [Halocatena pleomorpha]|uniref:Prenyltransferase n=1 Tax=Halocatena pleomorpha TaxID=1785090 RepID=A0A3P3RKX0_9EURY|nr:UbiA prenyltransferase family protein [Halocatena pleomorpha]RRJ34082.1 prenyltransferase [Halocatena pleomorpha]